MEYPWCKHTKGESTCVICTRRNAKLQEKTRKEHGPECTCYTCDWDDYWKHLGKQ